MGTNTKEAKKPTAKAARSLTGIKEPPGSKNGSRAAGLADISGDDLLLDNKELLRVLTEVRNGNFSVRMPIDESGVKGKICDTLNEIISLNEEMMREFTRAGNTIGKQGKLTQRIEAQSSKGSWITGVDSLNALISDL